MVGKYYARHQMYCMFYKNKFLIDASTSVIFLFTETLFQLTATISLRLLFQIRAGRVSKALSLTPFFTSFRSSRGKEDDIRRVASRSPDSFGFLSTTHRDN